MHLPNTVSMAALLAVIALPLSASTITVSLAAGLFTSRAGATTIDFNLLNSSTPSPYTSGLATYTGWSTGNDPFVQGTSVGNWAAPPADTTTYLAVGSPNLTNTVTINFATPITYFGFYMGSPDNYNQVSFYGPGDISLQSFSGDQLIAPGNGDQSLGAFVNFDVSGGAISKIVLSSTQAAFETDNHAYGSAVPEPGTLFILGASLVLLGSSKRITRLF